MSERIHFDNIKIEDGVYILSQINSAFESSYLKIREKEKRIYNDEELKTLPYASDSNLHKQEWHLRTKSFQRFKKYLNEIENNLNVLDLGSGNGWFSGQLSKTFNHNFYCVDVNLSELKQGRRVFDSNNLCFLYADIFSEEFSEKYFDIIIVNAAVQYFRDLENLINRLLSLLSENGEIHIIDSPFYTGNEVNNARKRTAEYFTVLGFPEMTKNYFHHSWDRLSDYDLEIIYEPKSISKKFKRVLFIKDSPFPWIKISR